jgi:LPS sulfotransferase NodH
MTLYLICCTMRSGSTLLERLLKNAGIGNAREYLHGTQPGFATYHEYAQYILNGNLNYPISGWRVMWGQLWEQQRKLPQWAEVPVETMLDEIIDAIQAKSVRYIYLHRRDHLRQAVSSVRAQTARRWHCPAHEQEQTVHIPFTPDTIARVKYLMAELPKYEKRWEAYFSARGISPLRLVYEDMTATEDTIRDTFWQMIQYIGAEIPHDYQVTIPLKKQAGQDVEQWIEQYQNGAL